MIRAAIGYESAPKGVVSTVSADSLTMDGSIDGVVGNVPMDEKMPHPHHRVARGEYHRRRVSDVARGGNMTGTRRL